MSMNLKMELEELGIDLSVLDRREKFDPLESVDLKNYSVLGINPFMDSYLKLIDNILQDDIIGKNLPKVKYQYLFAEEDGRFYCKNHHGVITIATVLKNDGGMEYALSFCSPEDVYDKPMGKDISLNRLLDKPYRIRHIHTIKHRHISFQIFTDMINNVNLPSWAGQVLEFNLNKLLKNVFMYKY